MDGHSGGKVRPKAVMLAVVKHPLPTTVYSFWGIQFIFSYSILHLSLFAFTFMYLNVLTLYKFGVFSTLMTGNLVDATLDINPVTYPDTLFKLTLIFCCTMVGTGLSSFLLMKLRNREDSLGVLMLLLFISCILLDFIDDLTSSRYVLCVLSATSGGLIHWSQKLGYVCSAMTGNMFKLAEVAFKVYAGYDVGGPKEHGDALILLCITFWAMAGGLTSLGMISAFIDVEYVIFIPVFAVIPLHLHFAGCLNRWLVLLRTHMKHGVMGNPAGGSGGEGGGGCRKSSVEGDRTDLEAHQENVSNPLQPARKEHLSPAERIDYTSGEPNRPSAGIALIPSQSLSRQRAGAGAGVSTSISASAAASESLFGNNEDGSGGLACSINTTADTENHDAIIDSKSRSSCSDAMDANGLQSLSAGSSTDQSRDRARSSVVFESHRISVQELQELVDVEQSFGYKVEQGLFM